MKVLIIEDDKTIIGLYSRRLEDEGYIVESMTSYEEALKYCRPGMIIAPDVVLLDHGLGNKEGVNLAPIIKKAFPNSRIIILSNYSRFVFKEKMKEYGIEDYLVKLNASPGFIAKYLCKFSK